MKIFSLKFLNYKIGIILFGRIKYANSAIDKVEKFLRDDRTRTERKQ